MASLVPSIFRRSKKPVRMDQNGWAEEYMSFAGNMYPIGSMGFQTTSNAEPIENNFEAFVSQAYKSDGILFAVCLARMLVGSQIRFQYQSLNRGRPGNLFGKPELSILENPWDNGFTSDLVSKAFQHADIGGNHYAVTEGAGPDARIRVLRPDWTDIILTRPPAESRKSDIAGYLFRPGGTMDESKWETFPIDGSRGTVAHWAPIPDPDAQYRGMSWIPPIMEELRGDKSIMKHKRRFFDNGATLQTIIGLKDVPNNEQFQKARENFARNHMGVDNAYKPLFVAGGVDVHALNADMQQIDFINVGGHGEPLALDTPVPTPSGWTTMGEIRKGDEVFGRDGSVQHVLKVHPVHHGRKCYKVEFNDGTSVVCDSTHLWTVFDRRARMKQLTVTAQEMKNLVEDARQYERRVAVDMNTVLDCPEADLPIDPYVLGAWLGDGYSAEAAVCGAPDDLKYIQEQFEERGYITRMRNTAPGKVSAFGVLGSFCATLREVGVMGDKHVPAPYLRASRDQRMDLLRGLMDTDGSVSVGGQCEFSTQWIHLALQVAELVRSLGFRTRVSRKSDSRSKTGESCILTFRVDGSDPTQIPFLLPRKVARCEVAPRLRVMHRSVVSVSECESVPVRCITVSSDDHLFLVGDGLVPTHNTRICAAGRVPPVLVQIMEAMRGTPLTGDNFKAAKQMFIEMTMLGLWQSLAQSYSVLVPKQPNARLWYDTRDVAFLRENMDLLAQTQQVRAATIASYIQAGFTPKSSVAAEVNADPTLLEHTGLVSVQLFEPGAGTPDPNGNADTADPNGPANKPDTAQNAPGADGPNNAPNKPGRPPGKSAKGKRYDELPSIPVAERLELE